MWHKINIHNSKRKTPRKQNTPKFKIKGGTHLLYIIVKKQVVLRGGEAVNRHIYLRRLINGPQVHEKC